LSSRSSSSGSSSFSRTPSTGSGGYSRSSSSRTPSWTSFFGGGGVTDREVSRQSSQQALDAYQGGSGRRVPGVENLGQDAYRRSAPAQTFNYRLPGWSAPPAYARGGQSRFGDWNATMLWGLLETLARPGHAEFFYHHADDPGYRQWRAEADARARDDPGLLRKLGDLDGRMAGMGQTPRNPAYLPPDIEKPASKSSFSWGSLFLLAACAFIIYMAWRKLSGDVAKDKKSDHHRGDGAMPFGAGRRTPYRPQWFRVGMTIPVDPSLFILAGPHTHVQPPEASTASGLLSVESLGEAVCQGVVWHRLYVSGGRCFFQVHLDAHGHPDECRYFSRLDEVNPADADEWGFWLDEAEGAIGWPDFQTRDGALFERLWTPGASRIAPREIDESLSGDGARSRRQRAMLYARPTGAAAPAPTAEYLLVCAVEQDGVAWVAIHAGMDVSVSALQLS
jgi:hypothetical protein